MRIIHSRTRSHEDYDAFWRRHCAWLAEMGYILRPKYLAGWHATSREGTGLAIAALPDLERGVIMDAIRSIDGMAVALKRLLVDVSPGEFSLARYFVSLKASARNHCVPVLDILSVPDDEKAVLIVMPLLKAFDEPQFRTLGEAVAFFTQIFEGLHFMHDTVNIAHGEIAHRHIMMDATPLYQHAYDPLNPTMRRDWQGRARPRARSRHPVRYYLVDFANATSGHAWNSSVMQARYAADVFDLGDILRTNFFNKYDGFEFMYPLLADMLEPDLDQRPSAERAYAHFLMVRAQLTSAQLRARLIERGGEPAWTAMRRNVHHWFVTIRRILAGIPAVPDA